MATWCCDSKSGRAPGVSLEDLDGDVRRGVLEYSTCIRFPSYDSCRRAVGAATHRHYSLGYACTACPCQRLLEDV